jgi:hypothetical protein
MCGYVRICGMCMCNTFMLCLGIYFNPEYLEVDRIIARRPIQTAVPRPIDKFPHKWRHETGTLTHDIK